MERLAILVQRLLARPAGLHDRSTRIPLLTFHQGLEEGQGLLICVHACVRARVSKDPLNNKNQPTDQTACFTMPPGASTRSRLALLLLAVGAPSAARAQFNTECGVGETPLMMKVGGTDRLTKCTDLFDEGTFVRVWECVIVVRLLSGCLAPSAAGLATANPTPAPRTPTHSKQSTPTPSSPWAATASGSPR